MREHLQRIARTLAGDPRRCSLEHRLFNTVSLLNGVINLTGAWMFSPLQQTFLFLLHVASGLLFLVLYWISRRKSRFRPLYWPLVVLMLTFLTTNAFLYGGSDGGTLYYLIPALVIATMLSPKLLFTVISFGLFVVVGLGIVFVEQNFPGWVMPHGSAEERLTDLTSGIAFSIVFTGVLVLVLSKNLNMERSKSDRLLLNVLPKPIAQELRENDRVHPCNYHNVTVLFTDFAGFTLIAEQLQPKELIAELDYCFGHFDQIINRNGLEKIKTIGDSYMAVGGAPVVNQTNAIDAVLAAMEIQDFMSQQREKKKLNSSPYWEVRIGINTGNLIAGVVGRQKFVYDVWGDTVNTASRMESAGQANRINISRGTYRQVERFFVCEHRGHIKAKNKGEIEMFFANRIRPELSADANGRSPNAKFWELYEGLRQKTPAPASMC